MAKKTVNNNNKMIIGVFAALAAIVVIVVVVVLVLKSGGVLGGVLNDDYFVSDGTKFVLTMDGDMTSFADEEYAPVKTHTVYYYSGDAVTGISTFYEYGDEATAKSAYDVIVSEIGSDAKETKLSGKYVEIVLNEDAFNGITVEEVRKNMEFYEMLKSSNVNGFSDDVEAYSDGVMVDDDYEYDEYIEDGE